MKGVEILQRKIERLQQYIKDDEDSVDAHILHIENCKIAIEKNKEDIAHYEKCIELLMKEGE